ncbi:hypothetical protein ANANG_G00296990 [Anguilla anguilla]|uniref:G-protein coupled receptors family 1 profile domain-containing protein n=1 Tax=Anguilla anguilla TaxID=7936 RepID=A0A9D3RJV5_ANGAN|nr:hypothetical protein ANANG_G00296990 [Anguilla anguilla]
MKQSNFVGANNMSTDNATLPFFNSSRNPAADRSDPYSTVLMPSIYGIICFLGTVGNCMVIYTIVKKNKFRAQQTVPDIFIFNLSIADLLFLLGMPFLIHQLVGNGSWRFGATMCTLITALDSNSQTVSTYILTVMTLDRYLATVHPMRFTHFVLAFAFPLAVICGVFFRILQNMAATVAPLPPRSQRVRTRKVTRMAVAICLAFFVCWAPYYILQLAHLGIRRPGFAFLLAYNVAISMGYANSCINPFLYIVLSDTFKRQLIVAMRPAHKASRVAPSTAEGSDSLRLAPECPPRSQSSGQLLHNLLPVTVAVQ